MFWRTSISILQEIREAFVKNSSEKSSEMAIFVSYSGMLG